jgi:hypothetical protein
MSARSTRCSSGDWVAFFEGLRPTREACVGKLRDLGPSGPGYHMMFVIISALDVAAEFFTKQRSFYTVSRQPDVIGRNLPDART